MEFHKTNNITNSKIQINTKQNTKKNISDKCTEPQLCC